MLAGPTPSKTDPRSGTLGATAMPWILPADAWLLLERSLRPLGTETVARRDALDRILASGLGATVEVPPCDVSAMDGYAVAEPLPSGAVLPVAGTLAAGEAPGYRLEPGTAVRIMTGAPVPAAAWTVVPVEETDGGSETVTFHGTARGDAHIRRQGEVTTTGRLILAAGSRLTPQALALLATHGHDQVEVYRRPSVATLSTGDEVVPPEAVPAPGQLRDSHTDFLVGAGRSFGLEFEPLGIARDDPAELAAHLRRGLERDLLLVTGGVSKGEFDYVESSLAACGCRPLFDAVAIQPGKPLVAMEHDAGWVFGLPGNPASAMVCFWLFVKPFLNRLMGVPDAYWRGALAGTLAGPLPGAKARDKFLAASLEARGGRLLVTPHPPKGSHDVGAYAHGSGLVRIPAHAKPAPAGEACEVLPVAGGWL